MSPLPFALATATPAAGVPEWVPGGLMAMGVTIITVWTMMRLRSRYRRRQSTVRGPNAFQMAKASRGPVGRVGSGAEHEALSPDAKQVRSDLQALMVDVQEVTRQCAAQIENRAAMLDRLVADAEQKINRLEHLLDRAQRLEQSTPARQPEPQHHEPKVASNDPLTRRVLEMASSGHSPVHIASVLNEQVGKVNLILAINTRPAKPQTASG